MNDLKSLLALPIGACFGALVRSSGVYAPAVIRAQMIFDKNIMMKMFMGGLAGSAISLSILNYMYQEEFDKARETRGFGDKGVFSAVLGGIIQGAGMTLSGSCPGMIFAQIGAQSVTAPLVFLGGVVGAGFYSLVHPFLKAHHAFDFAQTLEGKFESMHLERVFFQSRFALTALSFAGLALGAAFGLEKFIPSPEIPEFTLNPVAAGLVVGSLQLPIFMFLGSFLGMSSGYSVVSSQVLRFFPEDFLLGNTYMRNFINSKAVWQVVFGLGVIAGSAMVPNVSVPRSVSPVEALMGGFLLVFGARFVGGCASGHGLSGLPSLHVVSWFTVPSMFAGAMMTGQLMAHFMGREQYLLL